MKTKKCTQCGGSGWLWGYELKTGSGLDLSYSGDDNRYTCDICKGSLINVDGYEIAYIRIDEIINGHVFEITAYGDFCGNTKKFFLEYCDIEEDYLHLLCPSKTYCYAVFRDCGDFLCGDLLLTENFHKGLLSESATKDGFITMRYHI